MPDSLRRNRIAVGLTAILALLSIGVPIVNADAGPPRALFLQLPEGVPEPRLALAAHRQADGSWILDIAARNFEFTDLCVANARAVPRGHAHVVKDDVKIASAYGPQIDLGRLPAGRHEFRVMLRGQDHRVLVGHDGMIEARLVLVVPAG